MAKENETIADIIGEMKRRKEMLEDAAFNAPLCYSTDTLQAQHEILDEFIERFEAASRREHEALEFIAHYDDDIYQRDDPCCADGHILAGKAKEALGIKEDSNG